MDYDLWRSRGDVNATNLNSYLTIIFIKLGPYLHNKRKKTFKAFKKLKKTFLRKKLGFSHLSLEATCENLWTIIVTLRPLQQSMFE